VFNFLHVYGIIDFHLYHLRMQPGGHQTVHFITDNAGLEIVTDLYLADMLLHFRLARSVVFHVCKNVFSPRK